MQDNCSREAVLKLLKVTYTSNKPRHTRKMAGLREACAVSRKCMKHNFHISVEKRNDQRKNVREQGAFCRTFFFFSQPVLKYMFAVHILSH